MGSSVKYSRSESDAEDSVIAGRSSKSDSSLSDCAESNMDVPDGSKSIGITLADVYGFDGSGDARSIEN